ncbi:MAG: hypothetical protein AB1351_11880 [Thermoproteota archaeon]
MLEKHSSKGIAAIALLVSLAMLSFQLGSIMTPAYSEEGELDKFGIKKIYPTAQGGNEWYVDMDDPKSDLRNIDNVRFSQNSDGSWRVSADEIRMEAWSPPNEKWLSVEITAYAKIESGSNELLQMYSRGGHHSSRDECLGSAYKARLYGDGMAAWNKEVTHPAYAGNRAETRATTEPLEDRWIGFKAVIYNFVEDGNTYVRLESYIDDDVTDKDGNLVVANNWELASVYEDRGGWSTNDSDFDSSCGRERDEILTRPGGTDTQNVAAWRSDDLTWSFKYLSVREIDPTGSERPAPEAPEEEPTTEPEEPMPVNEPIDSSNLCSTEYCRLVASKMFTFSGDDDFVIDTVEFVAREQTSRTSGTIIVAIVQDGEIIDSEEISTYSMSKGYNDLEADFNLEVTGDFQVVIMFEGDGGILANLIALE